MRIGVPQRRHGWRWRPYTARPPSTVVRGPLPRLARSRRDAVSMSRRRVALVEVGDRRHRVHAAGEQDLGLVDVADAARHPLVEQHRPDLVARVGTGRQAAHALIDVGVRPAQVRPEVGDRVDARAERTAGLTRPVGAHDRCGEAHGHPSLDLDQSPHEIGRPSPAFGRSGTDARSRSCACGSAGSSRRRSGRGDACREPRPARRRRPVGAGRRPGEAPRSGGPSDLRGPDATVPRHGGWCRLQAPTQARCSRSSGQSASPCPPTPRPAASRSPRGRP